MYLQEAHPKVNDRNCTDSEVIFLPATCQDIYLLTRRIPWLDKIRPEARTFTGQSYDLIKRAVDLTLIIAALPLLWVILALCAILIKLESLSEPIFFIQERTGKDGRRFKMYKFRTMVHNAEQIKRQLAELNELEWPDFKIADDPRITRVGKFLRKTSLDELPQVINILKGEMSIVGPRPTSFSASTYDLWQTERLDVLPGLTGLWQILGRGSMEFCERACLDILYIERRCLTLDLLIILHTFTAVAQQRGAH